MWRSAVGRDHLFDDDTEIDEILTQAGRIRRSQFDPLDEAQFAGLRCLNGP